MEQTHTPDEVRALEQVRSRLHALCLALSTMIQRLQSAPVHEPLPPWQSLQHTTQELTRTLSALTSLMTDTSRPHHEPHKLTVYDFLRSAHVHTLPSFPGAQNRDMLYTMLRKKLDLNVEDWFGGIAALPQQQQQGATAAGSEGDTLDSESLHTLWDGAPVRANELIGDVFGLNKKESSEDEESSEEEDDEMEDVVVEGAEAGAPAVTQRRPSMAGQEPPKRDSIPDIHARKMMDLTQILPYALTGTLGTAASVPVGVRR